LNSSQTTPRGAVRRRCGGGGGGEGGDRPAPLVSLPTLHGKKRKNRERRKKKRKGALTISIVGGGKRKRPTRGKRGGRCLPREGAVSATPSPFPYPSKKVEPTSKERRESLLEKTSGGGGGRVLFLFRGKIYLPSVGGGKSGWP